MIGSSTNGGSINLWFDQFPHEWGISHKQTTRSFVSHLEQDFDLETNNWSDKGQNVFNSKISKIMSSMVSTYTKRINIVIGEKNKGGCMRRKFLSNTRH